jgi:cytochrome c oxidase assembly protein subunit 11
MADRRQSNRKNGRTAAVVAGVVVGMIGLSFASVPLYRLFCAATGYGGTPSFAEKAPGSAASDRTFVVRFDANTTPGLPWKFKPVIKEMKVRAGEESLAFFEAENRSEIPVVGQATFNVMPEKAAPYFRKIACFCLEEQMLTPGQDMSMPVQFFVDPAILDDPDAVDVKSITLSYTFFRAKDEAQKLKQGASGSSAATGRSSDNGREPSRPNG